MANEFLEQGLSAYQVRSRIRLYGSNTISKKTSHTWYRLLLSQFASPLMYVLLFAACISFLLKEVVDGAVIAAAAGINVLLGFIQEFKAEKSLEALSSVLSRTCVVRREGKREVIDTMQLVPGDLVFLEAGDSVPADGVILNEHEIEVNEAILTGESLPVMKKGSAQFQTATSIDDLEQLSKSFFVLPSAKSAKNNQSGCVYSGTSLEKGSAVFIVVATGSNTQLGKIADTLSKIEREQTPLQKRLNTLSNQLALVVVFLVVGVFLIGVFAGQNMNHMFSLAIALGVSAIPEGLVISLTALLAVAMQRLLTKKALVRKMMAAEVLGSIDVICTDKTGTLTQGIFKIRKIISTNLPLCLELAQVAMDLTDPMEVTLHEYALKQAEGLHIPMHNRLDRVPFDAKVKMSFTLTNRELFIFGAPESVIESSRATRAQKSTWLAMVESQAKKGHRVVAMAHRKNTQATKITADMIQDSWYFLGLVIYEDNLRPSVAKALQRAQQAGIRLKVITGDHWHTTQALLTQAGITIAPEASIDGATLSAMPLETLKSEIENLEVFYRTSPDQKLAIVTALKQKGYTVAMTGDGVNDALALKKADIGIVMENASSVSKETADMVLIDNNFATIIAAVEEGRSIIDNLRKILLYLLSDSFTEIIIVVSALALGLVIPITPLQILWVNLVNDGPPNIALTLEPKSKGLLNRKPISSRKPLITQTMRSLIGIISLSTAGVILIAYWWLLQSGYSLIHAQSVAFTMLGLDSLIYVFSCRSMEPLWKSRPFENRWLLLAVMLGASFQLLAIYHPFFQSILSTVGLSIVDWLIVLCSSTVVILCIESYKLVMRLDTKARGAF